MPKNFFSKLNSEPDLIQTEASELTGDWLKEASELKGNWLVPLLLM